MGVGKPDDILGGIERGVDMFDCVHPTRAGRHGHAYSRFGVINLKNARHKDDPRPLDEESPNPNCRRFSRAYLHHLIRTEEMLGAMILSQINLSYYQQLLHRRPHCHRGWCVRRLCGTNPGSMGGGRSARALNALSEINDMAGNKSLLNPLMKLGQAALRDHRCGELFAERPDRFKTFSVKAGDLLLDYSKNRIDEKAMEALFELARAAGVEERRDSMWAGEHINVTEDRAVEHMALRYHGRPSRSWSTAPT